MTCTTPGCGFDHFHGAPRPDTLGRLLEALSTARAIQWSAAPIPKPREDVSRSASGYSNPTQDIALDPRRLEVSEAVKHAEALLAAIGPATERLEAAVVRWQGE
jgi:hypothetical protein